ncbi:4Fe-4S binding domain protein [delta proteobacterium NaphS2]|nr:4Fe-4S binding domain protein [delta proteobacterium NaphS2]
MKVMRKIIEIDEERCDGCGVCVPACAEGAIEVVNGKARVVAEKYCDGLGACMGECPNDALRIVEREAEDFDEAAVEMYLKDKTKDSDVPLPVGSCPGSQIQMRIPSDAENGASNLTHWPVQIHLVQPHAPFLKNADLLVAADCTTVACANFHRDYLEGKVVLMGCPKFDDVEAYIQKFIDIFDTAEIKRITVLVMEVPCCSGLPAMIQRAMAAAQKEIPMETLVISTRGGVLKNKKETLAQL